MKVDENTTVVTRNAEQTPSPYDGLDICSTTAESWIEQEANEENKPQREVAEDLKRLALGRNRWNEAQLRADNLLYSLLKDSLAFYRRLKEEKTYENAFRQVTKAKKAETGDLLSVILKTIFGNEDKKTSAYRKALHKALKEGIDTAGKQEFVDWLKDNKGINGIIREGTDEKQESLNLRLFNTAHKWLDNFDALQQKVKGNDYTKGFAPKDEIVILGEVLGDGDVMLQMWGLTQDALVSHQKQKMGKWISEQSWYQEKKEYVWKEIHEEEKAVVDLLTPEQPAEQVVTQTNAEIAQQELDAFMKEAEDTKDIEARKKDWHEFCNQENAMSQLDEEIRQLLERRQSLESEISTAVPA